MRISRIIWGPLPRLFAQTLRCQYLVTPGQTTCTFPNSETNRETYGPHKTRYRNQKKNTTSIAPLLQNITRNNGSISVIQYPTNKGQSFDNLSFLKIKPNFPAPPYGYLGKIHSEHKLHQQLLRDTATNWWSPRKAIEKTVAEEELDRYRLSPRVWQ